jgi:tetratricopeptide (TPR) repeat protein
LTTKSPRPSDSAVDTRTSRAWRFIAAIAIATVGAAVLAACGSTPESMSARQALAAGIAAQRAGNFGTATADYAMVLNAEPKNAYALYDLGDAEQFQHQDAAAAIHYKEALAVLPKMENALYNLAIIDTASAPGTARKLLLQVIALSPRDAVARLHLGSALLELGQKRAADAQFKLATNLEPSLKSLVPPNNS